MGLFLRGEIDLEVTPSIKLFSCDKTTLEVFLILFFDIDSQSPFFIRKDFMYVNFVQIQWSTAFAKSLLIKMDFKE